MIDNLTRLALTGTSRQPNAAIHTDLPIDPLLVSLAEESAERRLLLAAGAGAVYRSAGQSLTSTSTVAAAARADTRPPCSPKVAQLLVDVVGAKQVELTAEAAQLLDRAGQRVPHDILPALLAVTDGNLRKALRPVLGERGRWLAPFNPDWLWAVNKSEELPASLSDLDTVWNEGTLAARVVVLARLHEAQPERARQWLTEVWPKEKAEPRAELLAAFGASLSAADEPFLEAALDDRSMAVRKQAAALLARIAGSRLSQRMIARADAMLAYEAPKAGMLSKLKALAGAAGGKLIVTPPQEIDVNWERDGIPAKVPQGVGQRAHWLRLVLSMVPLPHWQQRFGVGADILLPAARATDWWDAIIAGWTDAVQTGADADWRMEVWQAWLGTMSADPQRPTVGGPILAMLPAMPRQEVESCVMTALTSSAPIGILIDSLRRLGNPWSAELAGRCLARLRAEAVAAPTTLRLAAVSILPIAARAIPPDCFDQALAPWPQISGDEYSDKLWTREIASFIETVQLRKTLIEETAS